VEEPLRRHADTPTTESGGNGTAPPAPALAFPGATAGDGAGDGLHLLTGNQDISDDEFAKVCALIDQLRTIHFESRRYVERHGLAAAIFLPGSVWAEINDPDHFTNWTYDLVNYVRCASPFTGFDLMMWSRRDVPGQLDAAKVNDFYGRFISGALGYEDVAERLEVEFDLSSHIAKSIPRMTDFYDELVGRIPERYRIIAPPCAGEIGWSHHGRIINPDVILYQRRVNALYAGGALQTVEDAIAAHGSANYLEIGSGHCLFAHALAECFAGKLNVHLIDLPFVMANGVAYLACATGADRIGLVTATTTEAIDRPFVFVPNYLVPHYERHLPAFDLVHNAISFNEMTAAQVAYYYDLVERHMADDGVFHIAGGHKVLDYHVDAVAAAIDRFPNHAVYPDREIAGYLVGERPNTFIRRSLVAA
jgi:hypothetical protein